jgi:hypothetical protein
VNVHASGSADSVRERSNAAAATNLRVHSAAIALEKLHESGRHAIQSADGRWSNCRTSVRSSPASADILRHPGNCAIPVGPALGRAMPSPIKDRTCSRKVGRPSESRSQCSDSSYE